MFKMRQQHGMTLLEVMVAIAIMGLALAAMLVNLSQHTTNLTRLEEKTLAQWVAQNVLIEMELEKKFPRAGSTKKGEQDMAGTTWYWQTRVEKTGDDSDLKKLSIEIFKQAQDEYPVFVMQGFLGKQP